MKNKLQRNKTYLKGNPLKFPQHSVGLIHQLFLLLPILHSELKVPGHAVPAVFGQMGVGKVARSEIKRMLCAFL